MKKTLSLMRPSRRCLGLLRCLQRLHQHHAMMANLYQLITHRHVQCLKEEFLKLHTLLLRSDDVRREICSQAVDMSDPSLSEMKPGWRWVGEPLPEDPGDNGRQRYDGAVKTFHDKTLEPLRVKVGDVILMKVYGDPERWVAHCIGLCELAPEEEALFPDEDEENLDEYRRMRVAVRWLYRPVDFEEENADGEVLCKPRLEEKELLWTDLISDWRVNSVDVIDGIAGLYHAHSECIGKEDAYFCRRYYVVSPDVEAIEPPDVVPPHLVGQRLRDIGERELKILNGKGPHLFGRQNFWQERKQKVARKSLAKKGKKVSLEVKSQKKRKVDGEDVLLPNIPSKPNLYELSLEDVLPSEQMEALREKLRTLTADQGTVLRGAMSDLTSHVTDQLASQSSKDGAIPTYFDYEEVRDETVRNTSKVFWSNIHEGA